MLLLPKTHKKSSSRAQIDIVGVRDGVLQLRRERYRLILEVSAINFELKSESEQDAIIDTYQSFLNSLSCPLQFLIRTREIDIEKHLLNLSSHLKGEKQTVYLEQLQSYYEFLRSLVHANKILSRRFYVAVQYDSTSSSIDFVTVKEHLNLNADIVSKGFNRLSMHCKVLSSLEVLDLFYSYYSPTQSVTQPLSVQAMSSLKATYVRGVQ